MRQPLVRCRAQSSAFLVLALLGCGGATTPADGGNQGVDAGQIDSGPSADSGPAQLDAGPTVNPFRPTQMEALAEALQTATRGHGNPGATQLLMVPARNIAFYTPATVGFARAAGELGCGWRDDPPIQTASDTNATLDAKQIAIIQSATETRYYAGMAVAVRNAPAEHDAVEAAIAAGIEFITFDADAADTSRSYYVGIDNAAVGHTLARAARDLVPGGGRYLVVSSSSTASNQVARYDGVTAELAGSSLTEEAYVSNLTSLDYTTSCMIGDTAAAALSLPRACAAPMGSDPTDCTNDPSDRQDCFDGIFNTHPDIDVVIGLSSAVATGAAVAADASHMNLPGMHFVAMDGTRANLEALAAGNLDVVVPQRPYYYGYLSLYVLYALEALGHDATRTLLAPWSSGTNGDVIDVGVDVVHQDTLDLYLQYLQSIGVSPT